MMEKGRTGNRDCEASDHGWAWGRGCEPGRRAHLPGHSLVKPSPAIAVGAGLSPLLRLSFAALQLWGS